MNQERINKIVSYLEETQARPEGRETQVSLARGAGLSPTVINQVLKNNYKGNMESSLTKIEDVISGRVARSLVKFKVPEFINTTIARKIFNALTEEQGLNFSRILVLYGNSGIGKTKSVLEYLKTNSTATFIEVLTTFGTGTLLFVIAKSLDISTQGSQATLTMGIIDKLKGSNRMLIIDEAEYLSPKSLDVLRRIQDQTGIPLILMGMPTLYYNINSLRKGGFEQIRNRMSPYNLDKPTTRDLEDIIKSCIPNVSDSVSKALIECSKGTIRTLILLMQDLVNWSAIKGENISVDKVHQFSSNLN